MTRRVIRLIWGYNHRATQIENKDYEILMDGKVRIKIIPYNLLCSDLSKYEFDYLAVIFQLEDIFKIKWLSRKDLKRWITEKDWQKRPYLKGFLAT